MRQTDPSARWGNWPRYLLTGVLGTAVLASCTSHGSAGSTSPSPVTRPASTVRPASTQEANAAPAPPAPNISPVPQVTVSDPTVARVSLHTIRVIEAQPPVHDAHTAFQAIAAKVLDVYLTGKSSPDIFVTASPNTDSPNFVDVTLAAEDAPTNYDLGGSPYHGQNQVTVTVSRDFNPLTVRNVQILASAEPIFPESTDDSEGWSRLSYELSTQDNGQGLIGGGGAEDGSIWFMDSDSDALPGSLVPTTPANYRAIAQQAFRIVDLINENSSINYANVPFR